MKKQFKFARIFSFFVIFSMLFNALGMPTIVAQAAGITVEGNPTISTGTSGTTISISHTTGTGTNRLLLVGVSWNANSCTNCTISTVTFTPSGGSALSLAQVLSRKYTSNYRYAAIWYLPTEPPSGTTGTVLITFGGSISGGGIVAGAANFQGVDTITPLGSPKGADASSIAPSVTLTGLAGDELVFDTLFAGGTSTSATAGAGQSQVGGNTVPPGWNVFSSNARGAASTEQATGNSVVMDWTLGASGIWVDVAVPIFPTCAGTRYNLTAGSGGNGTVTLNPAGGSYCSGRSVTLIPVPASGYMFSNWSGDNPGDVVNTAGVYTIVMNGNKSVTANFAPKVCQDASPLTVAADTYLSGAATTTNYGSAVTLQVDGSTTVATQRTALLKWNVSSIPANALISTASITLNVTDASTIAYPLYDVVKVWTEGGATWATYDGTNSWGTAGAASTTGNMDRGVTNLWSSTTSSFTPVGSKTVTLNADGVAMVQNWVAGGTNNGVIIQQYSGSTNTLYFDSREGTTAPKLNINYCLPAGATHTLTVNIDPVSSGSVTGLSNPYAEGSTATITAVPNTGYVFDHWSGPDVGTCTTNATCNIVMSADKSVTANFVVAHKLTVAIFTDRGGPGGTTNPAVGDHWYPAGTVVPVTATANTGYSFAIWSGGSCSGSNPLTGCSVTMDADRTVEANFAINTWPLYLTFAGTGGGHVTSAPSGIDCTSSCFHDFDYSTTPVVLTAVAATGSQFTGWSGESCSGTDTCSVTMTDTRNVTATFNTIPTHTLTLAVDLTGGGTTDPAIGIHTYNDGSVVVVAATAASGYVFDHWTGDVDYASSATTTVTMGADKTATAHFTAAPFGYIGDVGPSAYADASGTSLVITVGSAGVAVGNTIIVGVASRGVSGYTTPTIADSKSNTYTSALCSLAYTHGREYLFYAPVTTALVGGDTITLTSSPAVTNRVMVASVFSGLITSGQLDQTKISTDCSSTTAATASNNATSGATAATTQADELVIGLIAAEDSGGTTPVDAGLGTWLNSFMAGQTQKSQNSNSYRWRVSMGRYYASATGTFTAAQTYTNNPYWAAGVATFKAAAAPNYTVTFNANGGTGTVSPETHNMATVLTTNTFTRIGYSFSGWNTIDVGSGTAYADGAIYPFDADVTLYAQWTAVSQTLTFESNGGSAVAPITQDYGTSVSAPAEPTKSGYTFGGWYTDNGTFLDAYTFPHTMGLSTTIYAKWTAVSQTLTFESNGGTAVDPIVQDYGTSVSAPANPTKTGYTFAGWYNEVGLTTPYTFPHTMGLSTTIYAKWTINKYSVTYNGNGSTGGSVPVDGLSPYDLGSTVTVLGNTGLLVKTGYTFDKWNTQADGLGTDFSPAATFVLGTADVTLYAKWTINTYLLTVNKTGTGTGTVASSSPGIDCGLDCTETYDYGTSVILTATPTDNYNRLIGWSGTGISCPGTGTCTVSMTAAKTVTAEFEKATFADVPFDYPRWAYIQALYDGGYTSGCSADPLLYCPENTLTRAESAVFMLRGLLGTSYTPPTDPSGYVFGADDWTSELISWGRPWAEGMWDEGMTAGCQADPLKFCPANTLTRAEGSVFGERIKRGISFTPPAAAHIFVGDDWTPLTISWAEPWAEAAYNDGLLLSCGTSPLKFCPSDPLSRSWAAYVIAIAKGLPLP